METKQLFYVNPHISQFSAQVLSCEQTEKGFAVILDQTAFYPEGGGQAADTGMLGTARVLDVREQDEFDESHIPGAILIPHGQIQELAPSMLPDKNQLILVYCRSGRRSKIAAEALEEMGYTNIKEFGGINDWPYETVGE